MNLSPQDRDLMIRTVIGEADGQLDDGQSAVAHVILNRLKDGGFGKTLTEVILAKGQFEPWQTRARELLNIDPKSEAYRKAGTLVDLATAEDAKDPTEGATYFLQPDTVVQRRGALPDWATGPSMKIGDHTFYYGGRQRTADNETVSDTDVNDTARLLGLKRPKVTGTDSMAPGDVEDTLKMLGVTRPSERAGHTPIQITISPLPRPRPSGQIAEEQSTGYTDQLGEGMPVVGPLLNKAQAAARAGLSPVVNAMRGVPTDDSFGDRYARELDNIVGARNRFAASHPVGSVLANLTGGGMMLGPASKLPVLGRLLGGIGETMGVRMATGAAGGAGIGAGDAALRGNDPKEGGAWGAAGGAAGPVVSSAVRGGTRWALDNVLPRTGSLRGYNNATINKLVEAAEGETPTSLATARDRMGPAGFVADINPAFTDLAGGVADIPGPGKAAVRGAYAERAAAQRGRVDSAVSKAMGPKQDVEALKSVIADERSRAADPLYEQWRSMEVHPTPEIKALIPRLEAAGAFSLAEQSAAVQGKPMNTKFFTGGPDKEFPTTESWDLVKRGLDRSIDKAYSAGDKKHAADLISLKQDMLKEISKTNAGKVWNQARKEFAERSTLIDNIQYGRDVFQGGRAGTTVDELKHELSGLSRPELQARIIGARSAVYDLMGRSMNGDTTARNQLLSPNNREKMELLLGKKQAGDLIKSLEQEHYLSAQKDNVIGNVMTGASNMSRRERVNALLPGQMAEYNPELTKPFTWLPPRLMDELRPTTAIERWQSRRAGNMLEQLAPVLTTPASSPEFAALMKALRREGTRRGANAAAADRLGGGLAALIAGETPVMMQQRAGR